MQTTAKLSYLRISPRKVRLVTNLIKGLSALEAEQQLMFLPKKSARPVLKLLRSAIANINHNMGVADKEAIKVKNVIVECGPTLKRWRARAMGRAASILKRTSHIKLILEVDDKAAKQKPAGKEQADDRQQARILEKPEQESQKQVAEMKADTGQVDQPKTPMTAKPDREAVAQSKNRLFSRQPLGGMRKRFRRKSI